MLASFLFAVNRLFWQKMPDQLLNPGLPAIPIAMGFFIRFQYNIVQCPIFGSAQSEKIYVAGAADIRKNC
jgi:hypothetical protein